MPDLRPAVFLDRDGTILELVHYLNLPDQVKLAAGAAGAIRGLRRAGYLCVVVTNQAAIAKGLLTVDELNEIHQHLQALLHEQSARLDGIYYCPEQRTTEDRETIDHPDRKPGPGMLQRAADELGIDLSRSWMVGDFISDALAGRNAGCYRTILLTADTSLNQHHAVDFVRPDLRQAAELILSHVHGPI